MSNPKVEARLLALQTLVKNQEEYIRELEQKNNELSCYVGEQSLDNNKAAEGRDASEED